MVKWNKFPIAFFFNECLCVTSFGEKHESLRRCGWLPHSITISLYHRSFHHQHRYTRVVRRKPSQWHRSARLFFRDLCTRQLLLKWRHGTASGSQTMLPGNWHSALFTSIRAPIFVPGSSGRLIFRPVLMGPCSQPVFSFFAAAGNSTWPSILVCAVFFEHLHSGSFSQPSVFLSFTTGYCPSWEFWFYNPDDGVNNRPYLVGCSWILNQTRGRRGKRKLTLFFHDEKERTTSNSNNNNNKQSKKFCLLERLDCSASQASSDCSIK